MKALLRQLFDAAVTAVQPAERLPPYLPSPDGRRMLVLGAGKAAAHMAQAVVDAYAAPLEGVVVTRYDHGLEHAVPGIDVLEAGHPIVDAASIAAGRQILARATAATADDRLFVLLSGGASALMECPLPGLSLNDLIVVNRELLNAGADIVAINRVRRQLSTIKGGGLARAVYPAELILLAISDVPGDRIADIGSGPCHPAEPAGAVARDILLQHDCRATPATWKALEALPRPDLLLNEQCVRRRFASIIATAGDALSAVSACARAAGFRPIELGSDIDGDATHIARKHAALAREYQQRGGRYALISGGETSVRVRNSMAAGGRNGEYLLALTTALGEQHGMFAVAADTDGIDGTGDNAGAFMTPDTLRRAAARGLDGVSMLRENRSYDFFSAMNDLLVTGPTGTNVNDVRVILVGGAQ